MLAIDADDRVCGERSPETAAPPESPTAFELSSQTVGRETIQVLRIDRFVSLEQPSWAGLDQALRELSRAELIVIDLRRAQR